MKPHSSRCRPLAPLTLAIVFLVAGCTGSTYHIKVDAVTKTDSTNPSDAQSYKIRSRNAVLGDDNWEDGRAKWRFNTTVRWQKGNVSLGWYTNYFGSFVDTGAATTLAVYEYLGRWSRR